MELELKISLRMNTITEKNENIVKRTSDVKGKVKNIVLIIDNTT